MAKNKIKENHQDSCDKLDLLNQQICVNNGVYALISLLREFIEVCVTPELKNFVTSLETQQREATEPIIELQKTAWHDIIKASKKMGLITNGQKTITGLPDRLRTHTLTPIAHDTLTGKAPLNQLQRTLEINTLKKEEFAHAFSWLHENLIEYLENNPHFCNDLGPLVTLDGNGKPVIPSFEDWTLADSRLELSKQGEIWYSYLILKMLTVEHDPVKAEESRIDPDKIKFHLTRVLAHTIEWFKDDDGGDSKTNSLKISYSAKKHRLTIVHEGTKHCIPFGKDTFCEIVLIQVYCAHKDLREPIPFLELEEKFKKKLKTENERKEPSENTVTKTIRNAKKSIVEMVDKETRIKKLLITKKEHFLTNPALLS